MSQEEQKAEGLEQSARSPSQSAAERISFFISLALVAGVLGAVGYLWMRDRTQSPPVLAIETQIELRQDKYYVPFVVTNTGGETAEAVQIIAELRVNGVLVEWGDQQIDFLSNEEEAEGAFVFTRDPSGGDLTVRVASYKLP